MNEDILKALALMQHEDEEYYILKAYTTSDGIKDDVPYVGSEEELREQYKDRDEDDKELSFEDWLYQNGEEVEPYDEKNSRNRYLVMTDSEADRANENANSSYIDDVVLPEIPEAYRPYFDEKKFKEDNLSDRGSNLAGYDGNEHEENVEGETFYIYQVH